MKQILFEKFFSSPYNFPWDYMGLSYPMYGETHSYLCTFMAKYDSQSAPFLLPSPSWRDLQRYVAYVNDNKIPSVAITIYNYCKKIYDDYDRKPVAYEVLAFLRGVPIFRSDFETKLGNDYKRGYIKIPNEFLY